MYLLYGNRTMSLCQDACRYAYKLEKVSGGLKMPTNYIINTWTIDELNEPKQQP